tara:strand:- start:1443 stop:1892 length:450 start_codon:yes stop_codon:yes gene_type:complete
METSLLKKLGVKKSSNVVKSVTEKSSIEKQINADLVKAGHEMLLKKYPQYYVSVENLDITKIDVDGNLKVNDNNEVLEKKHSGYVILIPQDNTEIKHNKSVIKLDKSFRCGFLTSYLKDSKTSIVEYVKINGKKCTTIEQIKNVNKKED